MRDEGKLIKFPVSKGRQGFRDFIDDLIQAEKDDLLDDVVIAYRRKNRDDEDAPEGSTHRLERYWFGESSCLYLIGLLEDMKDLMLDYVRGLDDE